MQEEQQQQRLLTITWTLWGLYILAICVLVAFNETQFSSSQVYFAAAKHWINAQPLYGKDYHFFAFPQTALFYVMFSKLWPMVYELLFRLITLGILTHALFRFSRLNPYGMKENYFLLMSVVTMVLGFEAALTGNMILIVIDGMLLTAVEVLDERWWFAAFYLILGLALSPAMLVMLLFARAVYIKLFTRAVALFFIAFLIPFFFQTPSYVWQQYTDSYKLLEHFNTADLYYSQLFSLMGHLGWVLSIATQNIIRLVSAIVFFILCLWIRLRIPKPQFSVFLYMLAAIFLLLFNPRTLLVDYMVVAPVLAYALLEYFHEKRFYGCALSVVAGAGILLHMLLSLFMPMNSISWIAPLMIILFSTTLFPWFDKRVMSIR